MGRTGTAPPTSKLGTFLSWPLALSMSIYSNFQINGASGETLKPPDPPFCFKNRGSGGFRVSPEAPFIWKLLYIGILRAKGLDKNVPNLEVGGAAPIPPTPPVIWVVL